MHLCSVFVCMDVSRWMHMCVSTCEGQRAASGVIFRDAIGLL